MYVHLCVLLNPLCTGQREDHLLELFKNFQPNFDSQKVMAMADNGDGSHKIYVKMFNFG